MAAYRRPGESAPEILKDLVDQFGLDVDSAYLREVLSARLGTKVDTKYLAVLWSRAGLPRRSTDTRWMFRQWEPWYDHREWRNTSLHRHFLEAHAVVVDRGLDFLSDKHRTLYLNRLERMYTETAIVRYGLRKGLYWDARTGVELLHPYWLTENRQTFLDREKPDLNG